MSFLPVLTKSCDQGSQFAGFFVWADMPIRFSHIELAENFGILELGSTSQRTGNPQYSRLSAAFKGGGSVQIPNLPLGFCTIAIRLTHSVGAVTERRKSYFYQSI